MYFRRIAVCLTFLFSFYFVANGYSDCGSVEGSIISIDIPGCKKDAPRCFFKRGTNQTIQIDFSTKENAENLTAIVHGIVFGVPIAFPLPNPDGCLDSGVECPVKSGNTYHYEASLPILEKYPKVSVDVKWELQDEEGKDIVCGLIPIKIN